MEKLDPKQLVALAKACRKAGIKSFKGYGMEFTLTDDEPTTKKRGSRSAAPKVNHGVTDKIESDEPTPEEMMFWSAGQGLPGPDEAAN